VSVALAVEFILMGFMKTRMAIALGFLALTLALLADLWQVGGIGIAITRKSDSEPLRVARVFPGSPAEVAGIKTNWFLISVSGTNVVSIPSAQCMSIVCGPVGTSVALELADPTMNRTNRFTVKRADVKLPDDVLPSRAVPPGVLIAR
jgi:C-terminal processing protease CtpA/Prc